MRGLLTCIAVLWFIVGAYAQDTGQTPSPAQSEAAKSAELRFEDFPAKIFLKQPAKDLRLDVRDRWVRENKADILAALKRGAGFAGHYAMVFGGCGTDCLVVHIVDMRNGKVFEFPESGQYSLDVFYQVDSRLMSAAWIDGLVCVRQDFEWTGRKFVKLHEEREKLDDDAPDCS